MKTIKLNIIKKNRVYFKCLTENNHEVKLRITPKSEHLEIGEHLLAVNDVSIRTPECIDVIYELEQSVKKDEITTLKSEYNAILVTECKRLGGRWDYENKLWVFPKFIEDKVEELDFIFNSQKIVVEITALYDISGDEENVFFLGYELLSAIIEDSRVVLGENIAMLKGGITSSGWDNEIIVIEKGSIFRLSVASELLAKYEEDESEDWAIKKIES